MYADVGSCLLPDTDLLRYFWPTVPAGVLNGNDDGDDDDYDDGDDDIGDDYDDDADHHHHHHNHVDGIAVTVVSVTEQINVRNAFTI